MFFECNDVIVGLYKKESYIAFIDKIDENFQNQLNIFENVQRLNPYLMLVRVYKEDEGDEDYMYLETNDLLKSGEIKEFSIDLYQDKVTINYERDFVSIKLNITTQKYQTIRHFLNKIKNENGEINIHA